MAKDNYVNKTLYVFFQYRYVFFEKDYTDYLVPFLCLNLRLPNY